MILFINPDAITSPPFLRLDDGQVMSRCWFGVLDGGRNIKEYNLLSLGACDSAVDMLY